MEDLPLVPAIKIIDHLSIQDVFNMKLVNKWFYQIINENVRIKNLVISTHDHVPYNRRLFYTCDPINLQHLIKYDLDDDNYLNFKQPLILDQLKQLYIKNCNITLETLNSFDRLVHLEIIKSEIKSISDDNLLRLRLPILDILNLNLFEYELQIDTPKLQVLKLKNVHVELIHPGSITHLEIDYYYQCKDFLPSCINLQHFYCQNLDSADFDSVDLEKFNLIQNLSKLKSIHFDVSGDVFNSLVKEKKSFNKDLKIYFLNLELEEVPMELSINFGTYLDQTIAKWYAEYYSKLVDHCPFVKVVFYNNLEEFFVQIPENFMKRFVNCNRLVVDKKVNDLDQLIRMLGECKTITSLRLSSSLGQHFFHLHLYDLCPNIKNLEIYGEEDLDCEFILKFKNIRKFFVKQTLSIEFLTKLIESHRSITIGFNFYHQDSFEIKIEKYNDGTYKLMITKGVEDYVSTLNSLNDLYELKSYCDDFKNNLMKN